MFQNGHFTTISGHYFANYMKIIISKILLKLAEFKKHAFKNLNSTNIHYPTY